MSDSERGKRTIAYLIERGRLESITVGDTTATAETLLGRAARRLETTAAAALSGGDVDGAYVAAYDAYRMAAEALLAWQGMRATGGDGSHMTVEDAVSAQFKSEYAQQHGLGGVMVWELGEDSSDAQLLKAVSMGLRAPAVQPDVVDEPALANSATGTAKE